MQATEKGVLKKKKNTHMNNGKNLRVWIKMFFCAFLFIIETNSGTQNQKLLGDFAKLVAKSRFCRKKSRHFFCFYFRNSDFFLTKTYFQ